MEEYAFEKVFAYHQKSLGVPQFENPCCSGKASFFTDTICFLLSLCCSILMEDGELEDFLGLPVQEKNSRLDSSRAHRIVVTVECLHLLHKLGDTVEVRESGIMVAGKLFVNTVAITRP